MLRRKIIAGHTPRSSKTQQAKTVRFRFTWLLDGTRCFISRNHRNRHKTTPTPQRWIPASSAAHTNVSTKPVWVVVLVATVLAATVLLVLVVACEPEERRLPLPFCEAEELDEPSLTLALPRPIPPAASCSRNLGSACSTASRTC